MLPKPLENKKYPKSVVVKFGFSSTSEHQIKPFYGQMRGPTGDRPNECGEQARPAAGEHPVGYTKGK